MKKSNRQLQNASTIASKYYYDASFHRTDVKKIISGNWQYIGSLDQLDKTGSYFLSTIAGQPLITIRSSKSEIRTFYNVCQHRGGPLAKENGCVKSLQCKYHGWTYNLHGQLKATPEFKGVENFEMNDVQLKAVETAVWENLIFIRLKPQKLGLNKVLSGISDRILPIDLSKKKFHSRVVYHIASNWKVYVDNYLEGYHLPYVHPSLSKLLDYKNYRTELFDYYSLQYSPFKEGNTIYHQSEEGVQAFYYFIFPNMMLNILPNRMQVNLVLPVDSQHCDVIFDYFYNDPSDQKFIEADLKESDVIQQEDIDICERVQLGLESNAYNKGRFSVQREAGVFHFQQLLRSYYE
ncbi:MAG: aromatic ring-hydroxylating dioxygenase subunit alpha [Calditrichaeota bacterium]|nr:aromatic ring-hydroxylating dioxygenase subunit alpha [Calditrichota bacterium]